AFFSHADRTRWVLWTPSGYYDASPGGEDLIGWHVNYDRNQAADFFPASRFRSLHYRPDVIASILSTLDETESIRQAAAENRSPAIVAMGTPVPMPPPLEQRLPPVIRIVAPAERSELTANAVNMQVAIRSPAGTPITGLRVMIDGRPQATERG